MDFGDIFHVLRKHWVVLSLALALTVAGTVGAAKYGPTKYQSQVQLTMLNGPKVNAAQANYGNPYLSFTQVLSIDVDLLTRNLTAVASMQQLTKLGATDQMHGRVRGELARPIYAADCHRPESGTRRTVHERAHSVRRAALAADAAGRESPDG